MNRSFAGTEVRGLSVRQRRLDRVIGVRARKGLMELGRLIEEGLSSYNRAGKKY